MEYDHKITKPEELLSLSEGELFRRVRPLLRKGGLLASSSQLERVKQNLRSTCWELAQRWCADPRLGALEVAFAEYLAATLCNTLRALDREQNPDRYDAHGKYQADQEPIYIDAFDAEYLALRQTQPDPPTPSATSWADALTAVARNERIAQPSIAALIKLVGDIETGKTKSPYRLARQQGLSTTEARYQPATGPFLLISDYLVDYTATPVATAGN